MMAERDSASITLSLREGGHQWIRAFDMGLGDQQDMAGRSAELYSQNGPRSSKHLALCNGRGCC